MVFYARLGFVLSLVLLAVCGLPGTSKAQAPIWFAAGPGWFVKYSPTVKGATKVCQIQSEEVPQAGMGIFASFQWPQTSAGGLDAGYYFSFDPGLEVFSPQELQAGHMLIDGQLQDVMRIEKTRDPVLITPPDFRASLARLVGAQQWGFSLPASSFAQLHYLGDAPRLARALEACLALPAYIEHQPAQAQYQTMIKWRLHDATPTASFCKLEQKTIGGSVALLAARPLWSLDGKAAPQLFLELIDPAVSAFKDTSRSFVRVFAQGQALEGLGVISAEQNGRMLISLGRDTQFLAKLPSAKPYQLELRSEGGAAFDVMSSPPLNIAPPELQAFRACLAKL